MDKYQEILKEIDQNDEEMVGVLDKLSAYDVPKPTAAMTSSLLSNLKVVLQENESNDDVPILKPVTSVAVNERTQDGGILLVLHLLKPQINILNWRFIIATSLMIFIGIFLTNGNSNSLIFLINGAPILGLLTLFYEHRAELYGTNELEASCPYTPAQLAGARIIVTLGYAITVCLIATGVIALAFSTTLTTEKILLWKTILSWLAPMIFFLGVALAISLKKGIIYGCGCSFIIWAMQIILEYNDVGNHFIQISRLREMPMVFLVMGLLFIAVHIRYLRMVDIDYSQER